MIKGFFHRNASLFIGMVAALGLMAFYLGIMTLTADWYYAKIKFKEDQWWIIALSIGLGIQAILFSQIRKRLIRGEKTVARSTLAASGGLSTGSMVACCLHHLADVIPFLGLPILAVTLQKYQTLFFVIGVLSNLFGILVMLRLILKYELIQIRQVSILKKIRFIFLNASS